MSGVGTHANFWYISTSTPGHAVLIRFITGEHAEEIKVAGGIGRGVPKHFGGEF